MSGFVGRYNARVIRHHAQPGEFLGVPYPPTVVNESWFGSAPGPKKFAVDERDWYEFAMADNIIDLEAYRVMKRRREIQTLPLKFVPGPAPMRMFSMPAITSNYAGRCDAHCTICGWRSVSYPYESQAQAALDNHVALQHPQPPEAV